MPPRFVENGSIAIRGLDPASEAPYRSRIIFATYAARESELNNACILAQSLRDWGGTHADSSVRVYMPGAEVEASTDALRALDALGVTVKTVPEVEEKAAWYHYAQKVEAAARAEADLTTSGELLAWVDDDTVFLQDPEEFELPEGVQLGYRPAMHRNIALRYDDPIDAFWGRVFTSLDVGHADLFPMTTPADGETIRPWINAGCLVVRPERGLLRAWAAFWRVLYRDPELKRLCETDLKQRIFLHQAALTCAVLKHLAPDERRELSPSINYPVFFKEMFGGKHDFDDLTGVVTLRHESCFRDPAPDWEQRLKGPADRIDWIRNHIANRSG